MKRRHNIYICELKTYGWYRETWGILTLALGYFKRKRKTKPLRTRREDKWELNKQMREETKWRKS